MSLSGGEMELWSMLSISSKKIFFSTSLFASKVGICSNLISESEFSSSRTGSASNSKSEEEPLSPKTGICSNWASDWFS